MNPQNNSNIFRHRSSAVPGNTASNPGIGLKPLEDQTMSTANLPYHPASNNSIDKGRYNATITHAATSLREPEGYYRIHVEFEVDDPGHKGERVSKDYHLTTKKCVGFLRKECAKLGIESVEQDSLDAVCNALKGKAVSINVDYPASGNSAVYILGPASGEQKKKGNYDDIWS